jgi:SAM-dependent methyltransferase
MSVESYFQTRAEQFHALYGEESPWRYWFNRMARRGLFQRVEITLQELRSLGACSVLDVGCGSGRNSVMFVKNGARRVTGIDFAPKMIALAQEFSRSHGAAGQTEFREGDFLQMEIPDRYDSVVALGFFDYAADPVAMLRKMAGCARHKIIGSFPAPSLVRSRVRKLRYQLRGCPVYFYSRPRIEEICKKAGVRSFRILPLASSGFMLIAEPKS